MAKISVFNASRKDFGDINIGPLVLTGPILARLQWSFLPDITFNLDQPPVSESSFSLMKFLKPKMTVLAGGNAYTLDPYGSESFAKADPNIFTVPTMFDKLTSGGTWLIAAAIVITGVIIYKKFR